MIARSSLIPRNGLLNNKRAQVAEFLWVAVPKVAAGLVQLQMNLLLTRALGPEQAGLLFVALNLVIFADAIFGAAFDLTVVRMATAQSDQPDWKVNVQRTALRLKLAAGAVMALIMALVCRPLSERIYGDPRHGTLLLLAAVAFASMLVLRSAQTYFQIDRRFPYFGLTDMANTLIRWGGAGVLLLQSAARPEPLMLLFALSPLVVAGASFLWKAQPLTRGWGDWTIARTLVRDSAWFLASAAAGSATARMDILLVSAWSGPREAGLFAAATNLVAPVQLLGQYLSIVFAPRIVPMRERGELAGVYPRVQLALAAAAAVLAVAFTALLAYAVTGISY